MLGTPRPCLSEVMATWTARSSGAATYAIAFGDTLSKWLFQATWDAPGNGDDATRGGGETNPGCEEELIPCSLKKPFG